MLGRRDHYGVLTPQSVKWRREGIHYYNLAYSDNRRTSTNMAATVDWPGATQ